MRIRGDHLDRYRRPPDPFISINETLKDLYGFYLHPKEDAEFNLIERYWKVVPYRLIRRWNYLRKKGRNQDNPIFRDLLPRTNPFLTMISKDDLAGSYSFLTMISKGSYYVIPAICHPGYNVTVKLDIE